MTTHDRQNFGELLNEKLIYKLPTTVSINNAVNKTTWTVKRSKGRFIVRSLEKHLNYILVKDLK